jgi:hypothetical protein
MKELVFVLKGKADLRWSDVEDVAVPDGKGGWLLKNVEVGEYTVYHEGKDIYVSFCADGVGNLFDIKGPIGEISEFQVIISDTKPPRTDQYHVLERKEERGYGFGIPEAGEIEVHYEITSRARGLDRTPFSYTDIEPIISDAFGDTDTLYMWPEDAAGTV